MKIINEATPRLAILKAGGLSFDRNYTDLERGSVVECDGTLYLLCIEADFDRVRHSSGSMRWFLVDLVTGSRLTMSDDEVLHLKPVPRVHLVLED